MKIRTIVLLSLEMIPKNKIVGLILIILTVFMISCQKNDEDPGQVIRIGVLLPLTGTGASTGESSNAAIEIAVQDISQYLKEVNPDFQVQLTIEDTQSDPVAAIDKFTALTDKGIRCIIGPYISSEVDAIKSFADENGILIVSPASVATSLSIPGDNIFRLVPDMTGQSEAMAALLSDDHIEVLVPVVRDDLWGHELLESTTQQFLQGRKEVIEAIIYPPTTTDFTEVVGSLSNKVNDALKKYTAEEIGIYLLCYDEGTVIMNLASYENKFAGVRWYGNTAYAENKTLPADPAAAAFAMTTSLACPVFGYDPTARSKWEPLLTELQNELGRKPEIYAFTTYDALWLMTLTWQSAGGNADIASLKKAFKAQSDHYFGATGWTSLNEAGDRAVSIYDFWGIRWIMNDFVWTVVARYNNATKELDRY